MDIDYADPTAAAVDAHVAESKRSQAEMEADFLFPIVLALASALTGAVLMAAYQLFRLSF
ncbi:hypothetical protein Sp245p_03370 [Azospirillum baldaniorum]|uniref:Uncharacterized protein n=1 Tax=Azospirillum baldaniorum TaxID=1064539 RepID=A0A9P1JT97_9PROT|nr:hypothetical protein [Azospirillum baldaniorum]AWJ88894.1 hypothetical protein Sp245p_03370 [Azospirillum baldaniorum]TWA73395.1 hypothetical protein FBZ85_11687 [Azospirillum brasilense]CCC99399.1 protein of unknown function [Azospirillum baldaniorum]